MAAMSYQLCFAVALNELLLRLSKKMTEYLCPERFFSQDKIRLLNSNFDNCFIPFEKYCCPQFN